jgi:hypothetical protein
MNTDDAERSVCIPLSKAVEAARLMESLVISLDRIGFRQAGGEADADTLDQYINEWLIGPRFSSARSILWDAIADVIGVEAVEEVAEATPRFPDPVPDEVHRFREEREKLQKWYEDQPYEG